MSETLTAMGEAIAAARKAAPEYRSLRKFAAVLDKSPSWVSKMERGQEKPGAETLARIAGVLGMDAPRLFGLAGMMEPDVEAALVRDYERLAPALRELIGRPKKKD